MIGGVVSRMMPLLRKQAESLHLDTVSFTRAGQRTWDEDRGEYVDGDPVAVYSGPGKVQSYEAFEQTPEAGEHRYTRQRYSVHVPVSAGSIQIGDVCTIEAASLDPQLVGRKYRVTGLLHKSQATAQRLLVDEYVA
jgi:hypothetical protein